MLALVALLTGACGAPPVGMATDAVRIGTCKDKTTAEEMTGLSDSSPAVPCTTPHTLETYAFGTLTGEVSRLGPDRPEPEVLGSGTSCPLEPLRPYPGAGELDSQWGVSVFVKHPTRSEWRRGVRTVLCDLVVEAPPATVPRLDVPLRGIMAHPDSARVRLCADGEALLTCERPHDAERAGDVDPGVADADRRAACEDNGRAYTGTAPGAGGAGWRAQVRGEGRTQCWLVTDGAPRTGTLRAGLVAR
ncbi:septum formation family protein [Kineococcus sp. LSe6-4]|uniref:Septum formation family protein n=1 Tax=Kineococcus halophytocola TaxID=3234027 RepID=A0ABV4H427_9ACTN